MKKLILLFSAMLLVLACEKDTSVKRLKVDNELVQNKDSDFYKSDIDPDFDNLVTTEIDSAETEDDIVVQPEIDNTETDEDFSPQSDFANTEKDSFFPDTDVDTQTAPVCGNDKFEQGEFCEKTSTIQCEKLQQTYTGTAKCNSECSAWNSLDCSGTLGDYTVNTETAINSTTGLEWQRGNDKFMQNDGKYYCESLTLGGYSDWTLPTIDQLRTLIAGCEKTVTAGVCGATDLCTLESCMSENDCTCGMRDGFQEHGLYWTTGLWDYTGISDYGFGGSKFWTSQITTDPLSINAWVVDFASASITFKDVATMQRVKCVRKL